MRRTLVGLLGNMGICRLAGFSKPGMQVRITFLSRHLFFSGANVSKVPFYQPETASKIFNRVMFNHDIATGTHSTTTNYSSQGASSAWSVSEVPASLGPAKCYLWDVFETCTLEEGKVLLSGKAIVEDYVLVGVRNGTDGVL